MSKGIVLVRNKQTNHIYQWNEDVGITNFTNLTSGVTGDIPRELANIVFSIPITLNRMVTENSVLFEMIKILNLQYDKDL